MNSKSILCKNDISQPCYVTFIKNIITEHDNLCIKNKEGERGKENTVR